MCANPKSITSKCMGGLGLNKCKLKIVCSCCCNAGFCCGGCCPMLVVCKKHTLGVFSSNGFWAVFVGCMVTQLCSPSNVCVWGGVWIDVVCIHEAHFPSSPRLGQLFCLHCTLVYGKS